MEEMLFDSKGYAIFHFLSRNQLLGSAGESSADVIGYYSGYLQICNPLDSHRIALEAVVEPYSKLREFDELFLRFISEAFNSNISHGSRILTTN